jgi:hypothetical protein
MSIDRRNINKTLLAALSAGFLPAVPAWAQ